MQEVESPLWEDQFPSNRHLRTEVACVLVWVAGAVILVDPLEIATVVLRSKGSVGRFGHIAGDEPVGNLVVEDTRAIVFRRQVSRIQGRFCSLGGSRRDILRHFDKSALAVVVEPFGEVAAMEHKSAVAPFGASESERSKQFITAARPPNILTSFLIQLDDVLDGGRTGKDIEGWCPVVSHNVAVFSRVVHRQTLVSVLEGSEGEGAGWLNGWEISVVFGQAGSHNHFVFASVQIIVIVTLGPLAVGVLRQRAEVRVDFFFWERRGPNVFQAQGIRLKSLMLQLELLPVNSVADFLDGRQTRVDDWIGFRVRLSDVYPASSGRDSALSNRIGYNNPHMVRPSVLLDETMVRVGIKTETMDAGAKATAFF